MEPRRAKTYKARGYLAAAADARRAAWLERQSESRRNLSAHLRSLQRCEAVADTEVEIDEGKKVGREAEGRSKDGQRTPRFKVWRESPVCMPDWMTDVPKQMSTEWCVGVRPDGRRAVVIAANGRTTVRSRNGQHLRRGGPFRSRLPGGNTTEGAKGGTTVLDCVLSEQDPNVLVAIDVMVWNDTFLYDCNFEFRQFWLQTRLGEVDAANDTPLRFVPLQYQDATVDAILTAYHYAATHPFSDGLLFYHREGHYSLGTTPLVLQWKDSATSKYEVETWQDPSAVAAEAIPTDKNSLPLSISLILAKDGELLTCDVPAVQLATMEVPILLDGNMHANPGDILRFLVLNTADLCTVSEVEVRTQLIQF